jgi:REP element-mobilizing transposase RayT
MWLASDHVHLHIDTNGESSVETMVQAIKEFSANAILAKLADMKEKLDHGKDLWDDAYFAETLG